MTADGPQPVTAATTARTASELRTWSPVGPSHRFEYGLWCAWQELNLLPFGPEPNALSGELQARYGLCSLNCALRGPAHSDPRSEHPDRLMPEQHAGRCREPFTQPKSARGSHRCGSPVARGAGRIEPLPGF